MLIKLIVCRVRNVTRNRFAEGQRCWSALAGVDGFLGQVGGWQPAKPTAITTSSDNTAVIVGIWRDEAAYDHFMRGIHDSIYDESGQRGSYSAIDVSKWRRRFDIPGERITMPEAIAEAALLRVARCTVRPERVDHFLDVQQGLWNPAMAAAGGVLAGVFSVGETDPQQFLVCTIWRSVDAHARYATEDLPRLREDSEVETDCCGLTGYAVPVEPAWIVASSYRT